MPGGEYRSTLTGQQMDSAMAAMPDAEAYAKGTRNGVDVGVGDPAYHNNAKYYSEEAARCVPAGGVGAVRYDVSQPLTETEKAQARANIGAGGGGGGTWGSITGNIADQTDLAAELVKVQNSNRNLVDNPWFTINQRGATTYAVGEYGVDRWKLISGTATVSNNQITLNGTLRQIREFSLGRNDFVCSVKCASGTATVSYDDTTKYFDIVSSGGVIDAVKLELGSVSTLHLDVAPNYAEELAKCQRYFWKAGPNKANVVLGLGVAQAGANVNGFSALPVPLRFDPTVEFNNLVLYDGQNIINVTSCVVSRQSNGVLQWVFGAANLTVGKAYNLVLIAADSYLSLSADL